MRIKVKSTGWRSDAEMAVEAVRILNAHWAALHYDTGYAELEGDQGEAIDLEKVMGSGYAPGKTQSSFDGVWR